MDNGHHNAIFSEPDKGESFDGEDLNEKDWQRSLEISAPAGIPSPEEVSRTPSDISDISEISEISEASETPDISESSEVPEVSTPLTPLEIPSEDPRRLGQITSIPGPAARKEADSSPINTKNIKTTGDYLDQASLLEIEKLEDKLSQDGNLSSFYDDARDLTEVNLNNSFNRKLYNEQENSSGGGQ